MPIVSVTAVAAMRRDAALSVDGIADLAGLQICSDEAMLASTALHAARQAGVTGIDGVGKRIITCFDDLLDGGFDVVLADPELAAAMAGQDPRIDRLLTTGAGALDLG